MTVWYDALEWVVEIAFDDGPNEPSPSWTDVSQWALIDWNHSHGRQDDFSQMATGTLTLVLDNSDRRFDPEHTTGPYYTKLTPGRQIRLSAVYDAVTYPRFRGRIQGFPSMLTGSRPLQSEVSITAFDLTANLGNAELQRSAYEAAVLIDQPMHYWPLQEQNTTKSATYSDVVADADLRVISSGSTSYPPPTSVELEFPLTVSSYVHSGDNVQRNERLDGAPFGLEAWVWADSTSWGSLTVKGAPSGGDLNLFQIWEVGGMLSVAFSNSADNAGRDTVPTTSVTAPVGLSHIACWYDGTSVLLYINGFLAETLTLSTAIADDPSWSATGVRFALQKDVTFADGVIDTFTARQRIAHVAVYGDVVEPDWHNHYVAGLTAFGHPYGERGGDRIARVCDEIGIPSGLRDLPTGDTVQAAYVPNRKMALAYMRDVETSEDGFLFVSADGKVTLRGRQWQWLGSARQQVFHEGEPVLHEGEPVYAAWVLTFTDDGSGIPVAELVLDQNTLTAIRNRVSVSYKPSGDGYLVVSDQTSIDDYGESTDQLSAPTIDSADTARGLARYRVNAMKDPRTRITRMDIRPRDWDPSVSFPAVLAIDIGNRVAVSVTPADVGSPISIEFFVQGWSEYVDGDGMWTLSLYLMAARESAVDAPYLIVGDPVFGKIGATAGNRIPF